MQDLVATYGSDPTNCLVVSAFSCRSFTITCSNQHRLDNLSPFSLLKVETFDLGVQPELLDPKIELGVELSTQTDVYLYLVALLTGSIVLELSLASVDVPDPQYGPFSNVVGFRIFGVVIQRVHFMGNRLKHHSFTQWSNHLDYKSNH